MANILVVDDEPGIRTALSALLTMAGHTVDVAINGHEAEVKFTNNTYDLCFMDISMDGLNGITATKRIVAKHPDANIVILTAVAHKEMVLKAMQEGARSYIVKPFDNKTIMAALEKVGIRSETGT